jgi:hypothetical protein
MRPRAYEATLSNGELGHYGGLPYFIDGISSFLFMMVVRREGVKGMGMGILEGNLFLDVTVGLVATLIIASALNRFGDAMFRRGIARPFYVGGHRLHHRDFLFIGLPAGYGAVTTLLLAGYVNIVWNSLWTGLAGTTLVAASCLALDLVIDYAREGGGLRYLHHEVVYCAVPLYAFSEFIKVAL